ncbi:MAG TPA: hypothetical protein K8V74_02080, partial [Brevibacterium epidermidis]|nr:hypothetical protein [Brevibacterium epidermidis]
MPDTARSHSGAPEPVALSSVPLDLPARFDEVIEDLHVVRLPMVTRFRGITEREVALLSGPAGWAE